MRAAYFSMVVALQPEFPACAAGLGVLADDTLRSAADLGIATAGISLVHRKGYFRPEMDLGGNQTEQRDT
jgi:starch phosphorylase